MISEGHTAINFDEIQYEAEEGKDPETIKYYYKVLVDEFEAQVGRALSARKVVDPTSIDRLEFILGGDHGQGAFRCGARFVITFFGSEEDIVEDFSTVLAISFAGNTMPKF